MGLLEETGYLEETTLNMNENDTPGEATCAAYSMAVRDTMEMLSGKWKIQIIGTLCFGKKRFMELLASVGGIAAKMLSKELQELELNGMVKRSVLNTKPITVEYELTKYGHTLKPVIDVIVSWGMQHRQTVMKELSQKGNSAKAADV